MKTNIIKVTILVFTCLLGTVKSDRVQAQQAIQFDLPLLINGAFSGDISTSVLESRTDNKVLTEVSLPVPRLQQLLSKFAVEEQLSKWFRDSEGELTLSQLRQRGLEINFDPSLLNIVATFPLLKVSSISLLGREPPVPEDSFSQANFASGLSFFATNTFSHRDTAALEQGFGDTAVDVAGFTTLGGFEGWSLFYEADFLENDEKEFSRQDVTLIRDNFEKGLRYSIGDISPQVGELQSTPDLLGLSVERDYREINPFKNINPRGRSNFTLDRAAEVSFEVNGTIVDTQNLEPGEYSISDFPLTFGANDVRVFVDDGTSRIEVANFSTFVDFDLLDAGLSDYGLSVGLLREDGTGRRIRYESDPVITGFYRKGINQNLTLGGQAEVREGHALIGTSAVYGNRIGLVGIETAVSSRKEIGTGYSAILRYESQIRTRSNWLIDTDLQFNYRSDKFVDLTSEIAAGEFWSVNAAAAFTKGSLSWVVAASIAETNELMTRAISTSLFKTFSRFSVSLDYRYSQTENEESNDQFNISVRVPLTNSSLRSSYRSRDDEYQLTWTKPSGFDAGVGSITRAEFAKNSTSSVYEIDAAYIGSRFEIDAQHSSTQFDAPDLESVSITDFSLGTSVGYADGKFAYGRPFSRGFVIVDKHKTLRGNKVFAKQTDGETNITSAKLLGTALVPINQSYSEQRVLFEVDDLPIGYDIGSGEVRLFPGNLAGYRYTIGSDAANTVLGRVAWPDSTPLSLTAGKLVSVDGGKDIVVFTNRTGRFVAEKVPFGKFEMTFIRDGESYSVDLELEETNIPGLVETGSLVLEKIQ